MDFLKRQSFYILCVVGAVAGILLGVTGLRAMPKVMAEMNGATTLYNNLNTLQNQPVNKTAVEEAEKKISAIMADFRGVVAKARESYHYEPLVAGIFPDGSDEAKLEFKKQYASAMEVLWEKLRCGPPSNEQDMLLEKDRIANEEFDAKHSGSDSAASKVGTDGDKTAAGVLTLAGVKKDPWARANVAAARKWYCFASRDEKPPEKVMTFHYDPSMIATGSLDVPSPEACWRAQLSYWIQRDIVHAIASMNDEAVTMLGEDRPWVGNMPVKEVISIRVSKDYVPLKGEDFVGAEPGGYAAALPAASSSTVFTQNGSNEIYDVKQFSVKLIMDQRDVLRLAERIARNGLHTLLRVAYKAVLPNREMNQAGAKLYGPEPVVNVVMDFETIMLGQWDAVVDGSPVEGSVDGFRCWMPDEILGELGQKRPANCLER